MNYDVMVGWGGGGGGLRPSNAIITNFYLQESVGILVLDSNVRVKNIQRN